MREIKFRAYHPKSKQMLHFKDFGLSVEYGQLTFEVQEPEFQGIGNMPDEAWNEDEWKLMQFTGLLDKNGKEIYEGDVVDYYNVAGHVLMSVEWCDTYTGFIPFTWADGDEWDCEKCEVVGNIYENPDFIKEK